LNQAVNALGQEAHTLTSSSAALGAATLANLCQELEVMSSTGANKGSLEKLLQLKAEYKRVEEALQLEKLCCEKARLQDIVNS